jgi:rhodanese-related sulfurtransferase
LGLASVLIVSAAASAQPVPIQFIKIAAVHTLLVRGTPPVLIDVRSREEYDARHITGAVSIPLDEISRRAGAIPRYPLAVLYCACPHRLAGLAYERLWTLGYRNVRVLDQGIAGWIEQGLPTEGRVSGYAPDHRRDYARFLRDAAPAGRRPGATGRRGTGQPHWR